MADEAPAQYSRDESSPVHKRKFGCLQVLSLLAVAVVITAGVTVWWVNHYLYASPLTPVKLSAEERERLESKLAALDAAAEGDVIQGNRRVRRQDVDRRRASGDALRPQPYSEEGARREVTFTEKELNALIAADPETAKHAAVDLADELLSLKLVIPVEQDFPVFGGKTLRLHLGMKLAFRNGRPVVALKGLSLGGVPLPNAWLGNLKDVNLVEEFGTDEGFWKLFADGVEDLSVEEGRLRVKLRK